MATTSDLAAPVHYALTHRPAQGDRVDLVLDLFRGVVQVHTRTIASVEREQAVLVMAKCRRYLQLRGVDATPAVPQAAAKPAPVTMPGTRATPVKPEAAARVPAAPMRPAASVKPMTVPSSPAKPASSLAARSAALLPPRRERSPEARMPAPAAAAFDWMFQAS